MIEELSEQAIKRNKENREREERIAKQLREKEIHEPVEPLTFSSLGYQLGRQGNRNYSWTTPIGAHSR